MGGVLNGKRYEKGALFKAKKNKQGEYHQASQRYNDYEAVILGRWLNGDLMLKSMAFHGSNFEDIFTTNLHDLSCNIFIESNSLYLGSLKSK